MRESDAVLVPSRYENFCNVALEAMAAGRPVVGSRCGGITDLVKDGITGLLFEPGEVGEIETRLRELISSPEQLVSMGEHAWHQAQKYSWKQIALETDSLFRRAILVW